MNAADSKNAGRNVLAFAFVIGQRVSIKAIDTVGLIKAITVTAEGTEYRVAYFTDEKIRQADWFEESEISRL